MQRRHHYERAFEEYLRARRIPYVAVHEARKALLPTMSTAADHDGVGGAIKSFDFVVYGQNTNLLIDIKGRKVGASASQRPRTTDFSTRRLDTWVTEDDVAALSKWQGLFGPGFEAAFVFIYWFGGAQPPDALFQEVLEERGEWYALRVVRVDDYASAMKPRSPKWRTVDVAARVFERISQPFAPALAGKWLSSAKLMCEDGLWSDRGIEVGGEEAALLPIGAVETALSPRRT